MQSPSSAQLIPAGLLVTVPPSAPDVATVRTWVFKVKIAVHDLSASMLKEVTSDAPEQSLLQPVNADPGPGVAVRITRSSSPNSLLQSPGQLRQSSPRLQISSLLQVGGGSRGQSAGQVAFVSSALHEPSPQKLAVEQSSGHDSTVSPPLHLPSPQEGFFAQEGVDMARIRTNSANSDMLCFLLNILFPHS